MRIELAGSLIHPEPLVFRFDSNGDFFPGTYMLLDYSHFEVICIGAGGGMGGGIDTQNTGTLIRSYGGAGGGGGFHRVRGLLSALPTDCHIIVGVGGLPGNEHASDPALTTDGGDGGFSSFNGTTCQASGGKGGKRVQTNEIFEGVLVFGTNADGGDGGVGNRTNAGGGALGGISGDPGDSDPTGRPGQDGMLFNNVGQGGGGGAGGIGRYNIGTVTKATPGGRGAYNPSDMSVYGPGDLPDSEIIPGGASGAKASPLNGLPTVYGQSRGQSPPIAGLPGIVVIRLTSE